MKTHVISAQIWLQFASQDLQRGAFPNTVRPDKSQYLSRSWCRQSVKFERVGGVAMGDFGFEIGGEIDDSDGFEGTPRADYQ